MRKVKAIVLNSFIQFLLFFLGGGVSCEVSVIAVPIIDWI